MIGIEVSSGVLVFEVLPLDRFVSGLADSVSVKRNSATIVNNSLIKHKIVFNGLGAFWFIIGFKYNLGNIILYN